MNRHPRQNLTLSVLAIGFLFACKATELSEIKKDPTYDPKAMRRVFVAAVVRVDRNQKMLEDEFVRQLEQSGRQAVAFYKLVPHDTKLEPEAWKKLVTDQQCDTVILSHLVNMEEKEKDMGAKINMPTYAQTGYGYYNYGSGSIYQPASYVRDQTVFIETRVFDVATGREVWFAKSKTEIVWGRDPVPQIRSFVSLLFSAAKRS